MPFDATACIFCNKRSAPSAAGCLVIMSGLEEDTFSCARVEKDNSIDNCNQEQHWRFLFSSIVETS